MKLRVLSLLILAYPFLNAASCRVQVCDFIDCQPGFHCSNGQCIKDEVTCDNVSCPQGSHCEIVDNKPVCVQDPSCEGITCNEGFHCELVDGKPTCTKDPTSDPCQGVVCNPGTHCENGSCVPNPPPPGNPCPKEPAAGSIVYMVNKAYGHGFDSTVRVKGDPQFCFLIHGEAVNDCHLEGWPKRSECEYHLLGDNCPVWEYLANETVYLCHDDHNAIASCDHFGNPVYRDDPQTPTTGNTLETLKGFEGEPKVCGLHRDAYGPNQGVFTIAHGNAMIRACKPDRNEKTCGSWKPFNH